jgi:hypothetical protein
MSSGICGNSPSRFLSSLNLCQLLNSRNVIVKKSDGSIPETEFRGCDVSNVFGEPDEHSTFSDSEAEQII